MTTTIRSRAALCRDESGCIARRERVRRWTTARECVLIDSQLTDPRMRRLAR